MWQFLIGYRSQHPVRLTLNAQTRYDMMRCDILTHRLVDSSQINDGERDDVQVFLLEGLSGYDDGAHYALLRLHHLVEVVDDLLDLVDATVRTDREKEKR